jgi:acyl-CoA thioester hydrolase
MFIYPIFALFHEHRRMECPMNSTELRMPVRFSDLDAIGHVNNARYLTFFEEGRAHWFRMVTGMEVGSLAWPVIVARIEIDYLAPIPFGVDIQINTWCTRLGGKSLDMEGKIEILGPTGKAAAKYKAVLVWFDYASNKTMPIPEAAKAQILGYKG